MSEPVVNMDRPGWYGKLPNLGDFASRRLPTSFVRGWDEWLQRGLASAREELGPRWLDGYLVAPIVRFWIGPGVLGRRAWAGLLMPSVDRVGRHFPLTLARPCGPLAEALAARDWYRRLDAVARRVLDVQFTVEDFEHALADVMDGATADEASRALAERLLREHADGRCSVWWCGDDVEDCRSVEMLPPPAVFAMVLGVRAVQPEDAP